MPEHAAEQAAPLVPDPAFADTERLFRRIHPDHLLDGVLADAFLPFPSFSVNREKYSRPEDVIRDQPAFGIAAFAVGDISPELESETGQTFRFGVRTRSAAGQLCEGSVMRERTLAEHLDFLVAERGQDEATVLAEALRL